MSKKSMAEFAATTLDLLKMVAGDKPEIKAKIAELEKQKEEILGGTKTIGPCSACKKTQVTQNKQYDFQRARWFKCPHGGEFCPDCLGKDAKAAREKRKHDKEQRSKDKKKK